MKVSVDVVTHLKIREVQTKLHKAEREALADIVVDIHRDAAELSPYQYGTNKRSLRFEVGPGGVVAKEELEGAVFSTSGYGGYLEFGTILMPARPYVKPAYDKNIHKLPGKIKEHTRD